MSRSTWTPRTMCWHCDRPLDGATGLDDAIEPEPGAVSLCLYCGAVAFFEEDLRLRKPTKEELDELADSREFRSMWTRYMWARQYVMLRESLMRDDRKDPDR